MNVGGVKKKKNDRTALVPIRGRHIRPGARHCLVMNQRMIS